MNSGQQSRIPECAGHAGLGDEAGLTGHHLLLKGGGGRCELQVGRGRTMGGFFPLTLIFFLKTKDGSLAKREGNGARELTMKQGLIVLGRKYSPDETGGQEFKCS